MSALSDSGFSIFIRVCQLSLCLIACPHCRLAVPTDRTVQLSGQHAPAPPCEHSSDAKPVIGAIDLWGGWEMSRMQENGGRNLKQIIAGSFLTYQEGATRISWTLLTCCCIFLFGKDFFIYSLSSFFFLVFFSFVSARESGPEYSSWKTYYNWYYVCLVQVY